MSATATAEPRLRVVCSECGDMFDAEQEFTDGWRPGIHWVKGREVKPVPLCPGWDRPGRVEEVAGPEGDRVLADVAGDPHAELAAAEMAYALTRRSLAAAKLHWHAAIGERRQALARVKKARVDAQRSVECDGRTRESRASRKGRAR